MVIAVGKHQRNSSKRGHKRSNRKKKRDSKGPNLDDEDDSHPSKDFFEPDEISITSAPHGGRLSSQILENDTQLEDKGH